MSTRRPDPMLDRLAALAREQEPPPLEESATTALVRGAMRRAEYPPPRRARSRALIIVAAAAVLVPAVLGALFVLLRGDESESLPLLRASLPTGDRLVATAGARFEVESATEERRYVSVSRGAVLFDVEPLTREQRFEVVTDHLRVEVRGTVFSVETLEDRSVVRVYEGSVEVVQGAVRHRVRARRMWVSNRQATRPVDTGPLSTAGEEAARRREAVAVVEGDEAVGATESGDDIELPPPVADLATPGLAADLGAEDVDSSSGSLSSQLTENGPAPAVGGATRSPVNPDEEVPSSREGTEGESSVSPTEPAVSARPEGQDVPPHRPQTLAETRQMLLRGESAGALAIAQANDGGEWRMLEADSLRGLRRFEEAATAYDRAATQFQGARSSHAGYLAAYVRSRHLGDSAGALTSLDRSGADRPGSPLAERAIALRARVLHQTGRTSEARRVAATYLERYPEGGMAEWMRALVGPVQESSD